MKKTITWLSAILIACILIISIVVIAEVIEEDEPTFAITKIDYDYGWDGNQFVNNDGLRYQHFPNGGIAIYQPDGTTLSSVFGFGIDATLNDQPYTATTEIWTWICQDNSNGFLCYNNYAPFPWIINITFDEVEDVKITHTLTNNVGTNLENVSLWYIHTVDENDAVMFNGNRYNLDMDVHLEGDFTALIPQIEFLDHYVFDYTDLISAGFNINQIIVGNASYFGHDNIDIFAVGITAGNQVFPDGVTVTLDPTIVSQNKSMVTYINDDIEVNNTLYKWNGEAFVISPEDIWITNATSHPYKFGANDTVATETTLYKYRWDSNDTIINNSGSYELRTYKKRSWPFVTHYETEYINTDDICTEEANCTFSMPSNYSLEVEFYGFYEEHESCSLNESNETVCSSWWGIMIDPSYSVKIDEASDLVGSGSDYWSNRTEGSTIGARLDAAKLFMDFNKPNEYSNNELSSYVQDNSIYNNYGSFQSINHSLNNSKTTIGNLPDSDNFTVSLWTKRHTGASYEAPFATKNTDYEGIFVYANGNVCVGDGSNAIYYVCWTNVLTGTVWQHIVATGEYFNSSHTNFSLYINGTSQGSDLAVSSNDITTFPNVHIGGGSSVYPEAVDEVKLYNIVQNATWVSDDYNSGAGRYGSSGETGLVGLWHLDEKGSSTIYDSENSYDSTSMSGDWIDGKVGATSSSRPTYNSSCSGANRTWADDGCYEFDGTDDYIDLTSFDDVDLEMTLSLWAKPSHTNSNNKPLCNYGRETASKGWCILTTSSARWRFFNYDESATADTVYSSNNKVVADQWTHVVVTIENSGTYKLYIDGVDDSATYSPDSTIANLLEENTVSIGWEQQNNHFFNGSIDQVQIWDRALSADEIIEIYNGTLNNSNYYGKYPLDGTFNSLVYYNSTSVNWDVNMSIAVTDGSAPFNTSIHNGTGINTSNPNLVGYWRLDGDYNDSGLLGTNDGKSSVKLDGPNNATGLSSGAMQFDGLNDMINVSADASFNSVDALTMSAWVRFEETSTQGIVQIGTTATANSYTATMFKDTGEKLKVWMVNPSNTERSLLGTTSMSLDTWYHVVLTYSNATGSDVAGIYLNGELEDNTLSGAMNGIDDVATAPLLLGRYHTSNYLNGTLDEVIVYNRSLNTSEITDLYKAGLSQHANTNVTLETRTATSYNTSDANLTGLWSFNNGSAYDETGNGNDGTNNGAPLYNEENGTVGYGVYADGNDYIEFINCTSCLYNANEMTFSIWFKADSDQDNGLFTYGNIFTEGTPALYAHYNTNCIRALYKNNAYGTCHSVTAGEWHHLVYSSTSSTSTSVYLDGVLQGTDTYGSGSYDDDYLYLFTGFANRFVGAIDEVRIYNRSLSAAEVKNLYEMGSLHIEDWSAWQSEGKLTDNIADTSTNQGNFFQFRATLNSDSTNVSPYIIEYPIASSATADTAPTITQLNWTTVGGFQDNTLVYDQILDNVTVNCSDAEGAVDWCNITLIKPDGTKIVDNVNMSNVSTIYEYLTDTTLNAVGTWTINITTQENSVLANLTDTFTVSKTNQSLKDGFFGYNPENIPSNSSLTELASYNYNLVEFYLNATDLENNFTTILTQLEKANDLLTKVGLRFYLDYNLNTTPDRDAFRHNITANFSKLLDAPYIDTVEYIKLDVNTSLGYTDGNITDNNLDLIGEDIVDATNNEFAVFSSYNSSSLDTDYIQYTEDLVYITGTGIYGTYDFDGTDDIIDVHTTILLAPPLTFAGWVKTTDSDGCGVFALQDKDDSSERFNLQISTDGKAQMVTTSPIERKATSSTSVNDGNWHFIVGVSENNSHRAIYVDGTLENTETTQSTPAGIDSWSIGARGDLSGNLFCNGTIDEVMIFNSSLSQDNITTLYNNKINYGLDGYTNANLVSWWALNEDLTDSMNLNNGSCSNCPTFNTTSRHNLMYNLAQYRRNSTTKSRMFYGLSSDFKSTSQTYYNNIMVPLTSATNTTSNIPHRMVAELTDGNLIVYNPQFTAHNYTYNISNATDVVGKEIWDASYGILLDNNTDGRVTFLDIPAYTAIFVLTDDVDHITLDATDTGTVHKETEQTGGITNHTDGEGDVYRNANTNARAVSLWDNGYVAPNVRLFYGDFGSHSGVTLPEVLDNLDILIINDQNSDAETDKLFWDNMTIDYVFNYMAVADYSADPASCNSTWVAEKKAEADTIVALNESMHVFIDGFDLGNVQDTGCFFDDAKNVTDYIKTDLGREVGVNIFTNFQEMAQLSSDNGFAMYESCGGRWDTCVKGTANCYGSYNSSHGYLFSRAPFGGDTGDYNKSLWYHSHNVPVFCVGFLPFNSTQYLPDQFASTPSNYSEMEYIYLRNKLLGYSNIAISEPGFALAYDIQHYDYGTALQAEPTVSDDLYTMPTTNGIIYYNSTADNVWFEDGSTFNNGSITFNLYDASTYNMVANVNGYEYSFSTAGSGWTTPSGYPEFTITFNETVYDEAKGHYSINLTSTTADGGIAADNSNTYPRIDWYHDGSKWTYHGDGANQAMVYLDINRTKATSIDTTTQITQTETEEVSATRKTNITLGSSYDFFTNIWTNVVNITTGTFRRINVWNTSAFVEVSYTNDSTCLTANPIWTNNIIPGLGTVGVCMTQGDNWWSVRFNWFKKDANTNLIAQVDHDDIAPTITINYPSNNVWYNNYNGNVNITINEDGGNCSINDTRWTYDSGNTTFYSFANNTDVANQNVSLNISCWDDDVNNGSQLLDFYLDTTNPLINITSPTNNTELTSTSITLIYNVTDASNNVNCTSYLSGTLITNITNSANFGMTNSTLGTQGESYNYNVSCTDIAGNSASSYITFSIAPEAETSGTSGGPSPSAETVKKLGLDQTGWDYCGDQIAQYGTCFYYNGSHCIQGCQNGYFCDAVLKCQPITCKDGFVLNNGQCVPEKFNQLKDNLTQQYIELTDKYFKGQMWAIPTIAVVILLSLTFIFKKGKKKDEVIIEGW